MVLLYISGFYFLLVILKNKLAPIRKKFKSKAHLGDNNVILPKIYCANEHYRCNLILFFQFIKKEKLFDICLFY